MVMEKKKLNMFSYTLHKVMMSAKAKDNGKCQPNQLCKDVFFLTL
jgi:hypothetical protein